MLWVAGCNWCSRLAALPAPDPLEGGIWHQSDGQPSKTAWMKISRDQPLLPRVPRVGVKGVPPSCLLSLVCADQFPALILLPLPVKRPPLFSFRRFGATIPIRLTRSPSSTLLPFVGWESSPKIERKKVGYQLILTPQI